MSESQQSQQSLSDIYAEFDQVLEKTKKKSSKPKYTRTTASENTREIQLACGFENKLLPEECINGGIICYGESYKEVLRGMMSAEEIYLDVETGSYDPKITSLNPWKNCWPIGIAISASYEGPEYYIPIDKSNENQVYDLLFELFHHVNCKRWVNQNIKYDAHVLFNSGGITIPYNVQLVDTLTLAKLIDSERFRYGLDALSKDWLDEDISPYEKLFKPYLYKNKDYSAIPIDIIGPYACQDIITNKKLYKYICGNLPEECYTVRDIEINLTSVLVDIERNGMRIDPQHLQITEINNYKTLIEIEERLEAVTGRSFRPHTNADCFDILCNFYGLPVLKWTKQKEDEVEIPAEIKDGEEDEEQENTNTNKKGGPSFNKDALVAYLSHPTVLANPNIREVVELIIQYRKLHTFNGLFVKKYIELASNELLHPFYNQCVRSGRLSCSEPNAQQLDELAKELILPYENEIFVSYDFSQIEYRTIAHYIESPILLDKYNNDPDVDFHEFVAELVRLETGLEGMTRRGGKTLNFGLGFGMGKAKLLRSLQGSKDLMDSLTKEIEEAEVPIEEREEVFAKESEKRAEKVFNAYHRTFPEMKRTSRQAQAVCEKRGYIKNLYNRRRHLPHAFAYKAFNTINQASAADMMKDAMVRIWHLTRGTKIKIVASVHDEILFSLPKQLAEDMRILHTIAWILEHPILPNDPNGNERKLLVPIRVAMGIGENWKIASKSAKVHNYDKFVSIKEFEEIVQNDSN